MLCNAFDFTYCRYAVDILYMHSFVTSISKTRLENLLVMIFWILFCKFDFVLTVLAHHRMGVFPHTWQPLSTLDPLADRHRSTHRTLSKGFDMTAKATESTNSEVTNHMLIAVLISLFDFILSVSACFWKIILSHWLYFVTLVLLSLWFRYLVNSSELHQRFLFHW